MFQKTLVKAARCALRKVRHPKPMHKEPMTESPGPLIMV
jgi:hypothetical protein